MEIEKKLKILLFFLLISKACRGRSAILFVPAAVSGIGRYGFPPYCL
jgi:hypothetical protein